MANSSRCHLCDHSIPSESDPASVCPACGFPNEQFAVAIDNLNIDSLPDNVVSQVRPKMTRYAESRISIGIEAPTVIGKARDNSGDANRVCVPHQALADNHAILIRGTSDTWIVSLVTEGEALFVNGAAVSHCKLRPGDVVQIAAFGWQYTDQPATLTPLAPFLGHSLTLKAEVKNRLTQTELHVPSGQLTAIIGPSGCGKSTLIHAIREKLGDRGDLYFMQQRDLVHEDLHVKHELDFVAKLFGNDDILPCDFDDALNNVGLTSLHANRFPKELSGGELRRSRIAAALLSRQGLVVLDEPDSGLDHETATEIIRVLRAIAFRGATVIAVTHHRHVLDLFDRVIELEKTPEGGRIVSDSLPSEMPTTTVDDKKGVDVSVNQRTSFVSQLSLLARRETRKFLSTRTRIGWKSLGVKAPTCLMMLLVVPLFFALAISVSVPSDPNRDIAEGIYGKYEPINLLGFLAVVSVIWMASSLAHLTLARERDLYDHERTLGVQWTSLLAAKGFVFSVAAMVQATVFLAGLHGLRSEWLDRSYFVTESAWAIPQVWVCLCLVAVASTAMGLSISAFAGSRALVAAAVLPVVMMIQILFSVPFAVSDEDSTNNMSGYHQLAWNPSDENADPKKLPLKATSIVSYGTISRYGDQWLRTFAADVDPVENHRAWQTTSVAGLISSTFFFYALCLNVLFVQDKRRRMSS